MLFFWHLWTETIIHYTTDVIKPKQQNKRLNTLFVWKSEKNERQKNKRKSFISFYMYSGEWIIFENTWTFIQMWHVTKIKHLRNSVYLSFLAMGGNSTTTRTRCKIEISKIEYIEIVRCIIMEPYQAKMVGLLLHVSVSVLHKNVTFED